MFQISSATMRSAAPMANAHASEKMASACSACPVRDLNICGSLCEDELVALELISRHLTLEPKTVLMEEGTPGDHVFNIISGSVLLSKLLPDGRRQVVGIAISGDFLGLSFDDYNAFTATALGEIKVCRYPRAQFEGMVQRSPTLLRRLHVSTGHELNVAQDHMMLLGRRNAEEKIACFLLNLRDRWAKLKGPSVRIDLPMTRQDIADYLGLTVETVSRNLTRLAREKLIAIIPDGVRVLDAARLAHVARL
jgi:CRP/FNR family transcriptional regulator, anaerobic regulatory protein